MGEKIAKGIFIFFVVLLVLIAAMKEISKPTSSQTAPLNQQTTSETLPKSPNQRQTKAEQADILAEAHRLLASPSEQNFLYASGMLARLPNDSTARAQGMTDLRRGSAKFMEHTFLMNGVDATVTASEKHARTLKIKYILMSRPMAYQIIQEQGEFYRQLGFRKVVYANDDQWWSWALN